MADNKFRFINENCPVCNNEFQPDDDIVVCPLCGTPHHRECYNQSRKCVNDSLHNEGFRWSASFKEEPKIEKEPDFQPENQSASENRNNAPFPPFNMPFPPHQENPFKLFPEEMTDGVATEEAATFVQQDSVKYVQKFFYAKFNKRTMNWAAFFFAPYWFFYRKMYKLGAIFMALLLAISFISFLPPVERFYEATVEYEEQIDRIASEDMTTEEMQKAITDLSQEAMDTLRQNYLGAGLFATQTLLSILISVYIGLNANKWYYHHVIDSIKKIKEQESDKEKRSVLYYKTGGVSYSAAFLSVLVEKIFIYGFDLILMLFTH